MALYMGGCCQGNRLFTTKGYWATRAGQSWVFGIKTQCIITKSFKTESAGEENKAEKELHSCRNVEESKSIYSVVLGQWLYVGLGYCGFTTWRSMAYENKKMNRAWDQNSISLGQWTKSTISLKRDRLVIMALVTLATINEKNTYIIKKTTHEQCHVCRIKIWSLLCLFHTICVWSMSIFFIAFLPSISRRINKRWKGDRIMEKGHGKSRELVRETKAAKNKKRKKKKPVSNNWSKTKAL